MVVIIVWMVEEAVRATHFMFVAHRWVGSYKEKTSLSIIGVTGISASKCGSAVIIVGARMQAVNTVVGECRCFSEEKICGPTTKMDGVEG